MKHVAFLMLSLGKLVVGCGSAGSEQPFRPVPNPMAGDFCAAQHQEGDLTVCDALYEEAPLVHLPPSDATRAYAALKADP